nr:gamma-glutamyltransferase [Saprospiraceae bacterium]
MKYGAVAAGHPKTAEVAMEVLRAGGNATDALIAAYVASFISEPCMGSPGGGAFALLKNAGRQPVLLDFFCQTPREKKPGEEYDFRAYTVEFGEEGEVFYTGRGSVAVPGAIAGLFAMHNHSGTIPIKELFAPGVELLRTGVPLNGFQRYDIGLLEGIVCHSTEGKKIFCNSDHKLKEEGEIICLPALGDYMEILGFEGPREFYEGFTARQQQYYYENEGGSICAEDLKNYRVMIGPPLNIPLGDRAVFCNPAPALGGVVMGAALSKLWESQHVPEPGSAEYFTLFYQAFSFARELQINPGKLSAWLHHQLSRKWGSTSHISIVDKKGNAAALTTTIGEGNGFYEPETQIHMNNMLGESALLPGGYHSWYPDVRLSSMMNPVMSIGPSGETLVMGSGGAGRIPYVLAAVIWNLFAANMNLREAVIRPRLHFDGNTFHIEKAENLPLLDTLDFPLKLWKNNSLFFGGVHAVYSSAPGKAEAIGDFRREGVNRVE